MEENATPAPALLPVVAPSGALVGRARPTRIALGRSVVSRAGVGRRSAGAPAAKVGGAGVAPLAAEDGGPARRWAAAVAARPGAAAGVLRVGPAGPRAPSVAGPSAVLAARPLYRSRDAGAARPAFLPRRVGKAVQVRRADGSGRLAPVGAARLVAAQSAIGPPSAGKAYGLAAARAELRDADAARRP